MSAIMFNYNEGDTLILPEGIEAFVEKVRKTQTCDAICLEDDSIYVLDLEKRTWTEITEEKVIPRGKLAVVKPEPVNE